MAAPPSFEPPVTTRHDQLPMRELDWAKFESFCCELLTHLAPDFSFENYGKQGDKQRGIDLRGRSGDGRLWVAQCKKVEQFDATQARAAVKAMELEADKYLLLLSVEAKVKVREVIDETPQWELWDVKDLSRRVRELPLDTARRLVEDYFGPQWSEAFLGHRTSTSLFTPEDYFARLLDETRLFHHAGPLVGRGELLDELDGLWKGTHDAALLCGGGGIGKTKLLYEWSKRARERAPATHVRFIEPALMKDDVHAIGLPTRLCVLVVDDAHIAGDLDPLLALVESRPNLKLLLACRPQAERELRSRLSRADFDSRKTLHLDVPPLSEEEVLALARQGLGEGQSPLAGSLADMTRDSPFATVVGARLIRERKLEPHLLSSDRDFKEQLFQRFEEILLGKVSSQVEPHFCLKLLRLLSALSPFDLDDTFLPEQACKFLAVEEETLRKALEALVEVGVLLRTGSQLRITPDLLSEHIFQEACVIQGQSTGYAEKVFTQFASIRPETVAFNLAVLSWRLREANETPPGFLDGIWVQLKQIIQDGSNHDRLFVMRLVVAAAYREPRRALECAEALFQSLYAERTDDSQALPPELQRQAFTVLYLVVGATETAEPTMAHHSLDLIWQVGRDDSRALEWGRSADHGIGVLSSIARYHPGKLEARYGFVLEAIERWLGEPDALEYTHTPLPILEALLRKRINLTYKKGDGRIFEPSFADAVQMEPTRQRALALVARCARAGSPLAFKDAVRCLAQVLRPPSVRGEEPHHLAAQWVPEQLQVLQLLEQLASELHDPLYHRLLVDALYPTITGPMDPRVSERMRAFICSIPDVFELRLSRALSYGLLWGGFFGDPPEEVAALWPQPEELLPGVAKEFCERFSSPAEGCAHLQARLAFISQIEEDAGHADEFLRTIANTHPAYAQAFCEHVLTLEPMPLESLLPAMLGALREHASDWFLSTIRSLVASGNPRLRNLTARSYVSVCLKKKEHEALKFQEEELQTLRTLLADTSLQNRDALLYWIHVLEPAVDPWLIETLVELDIGKDPDLARHLCFLLKNVHDRGGLPPEQLDVFLRKLRPVPNLSSSIQLFLAEVAAGPRAPQAIELVLGRIQDLETEVPKHFAPFPLEPEFPFPRPLGNSEHATSSLQAVLARYPGATAVQRRWLALLFNALSSGCGTPESTALLEDQARTGDASSLDAVASVLSYAPVDFVLDQFDLTRRLVERVSTLEETCARNFTHRLLQRAVWGAGENGGISFVPRGEQRLDRSRRRRSELKLGSRAYRFYVSLCERLEQLPREVNT